MTDVSGVGSTSSTSSTNSTQNSALTMSGAQFSALGIGSGIDLQSIVQALVNEFSQPQTQLQNSVATHQALISQYQTLNTNFSAIQTAAQKLNIGVDWQVKTATSTDPSVTATATTAAQNGSFSFSVQNLAQAEIMASSGTVASTDTVIGSGDLLLGNISSLPNWTGATGSGLAAGAHTISVTQSSAAATSGTGTALGSSITIAGGQTLSVSLDGGANTNINLTAGTYTPTSLAAMITTASGGTLNVSANASNQLVVSSTEEGSAATLKITGGNALNTLGLNGIKNVLYTGTDGIVSVDGVANTVTSVSAGSNNITFNGTTGETVTGSFTGGLRVGGPATLQSIDMGDGKLSTVVDNINAAGLGVTAAEVQVAPNQYKLQLQSTTTGSAGAITMDPNAFASTGLGTMNIVTAAQDATLQVGTGANAYTITSSSNTISNVMPGLTLNLVSADPSKTITVNVTGDENKLQGQVQDLVNAVNTAMSYITTNSGYDAAKKQAGPLLGNFEAETLQNQIQSAMNSLFPGSTLGGLDGIGITQNDDGTYAFDTSKFQQAYANDPNAVASLFVDGGTSGTATGNPGIATTLANIAQNATDAVSGSITTVINGENTTIQDLNTQIDEWTTRIKQYQNQLLLQFSAADTTVANLKSQQTYLSGQITSLQTQG